VSELSTDEKLALAIPFGVGTFVVTAALAQVGLGLFGLLAAHKLQANDPAQTGAMGLLVVSLVVAGIACVGGALLLRLNVIGRYGVAALGGVGLLLILVAPVAQIPQYVGTNVVALGLLIPPVGRWFSDERERGLAVPRGAYTAAVAWMALLLVGFVVAPAFKKMVAETGIALPALTEVYISLYLLLDDFHLLLLAPIVAVLAPFLLVGRNDLGTRVAVNAVGGLAFAVMLFAYLLPLFELLGKL
jgi:hypothetical protein